MRKKRGCFIILFLAVIFFISFAEADFIYHQDSIKTNYRGGEIITGRINLSLEKVPVDSVLKSSLGGSINLYDLIISNGYKNGIDYTCSTNECKEEYKIIAPVSEFELAGEKTLGIKLSGNDIRGIDILEFDVVGSSSASCSAPFEIQIGENESNRLSANYYNDRACSAKKYGCFNNSLKEYTNIEIGSESLCESITAGPGPAYRIGAMINKSGGEAGALEMTAEKPDGSIFSCMLPENNESEQEADCIVNISSVKEITLSVCILNQNQAEYIIQSESNGQICGNFNRDFSIFAYPLEYNVSTVKVNSREFENAYSAYLEDYIYDYLKENYGENNDGGIICRPCIVPVKLYGLNQKVKIDNVKFKFEDGGLVVAGGQYNALYEIAKNKTTITAKSIGINLEPAHFVVPSEKQNVLKLLLNEQVIVEKKINISEGFNFNIEPKFALFGLDTEFNIIGEINVSSVRWSFGDKETAQTESKKAVHRYKEQGEFNMEVEVKRNDGAVSVRSFKIISGYPKESLEILLKRNKDRLTNLGKDIENIPAWLKENVKNTTRIEAKKMALKSLEEKFLNSSSDQEYELIITDILKLNIPYSITQSKKGNVPIESGFDKINVGYIKEISEDEDIRDKELKQEIATWFRENYAGSIEYAKTSSFFDSGDEVIATSFKIKTEPPLDKGVFLIVDYALESVVFKTSYGALPVKEGRGFYIESKNNEDYEFYVLEDIEAEDLGAYISPVIGELGSQSNKPICTPGEECSAEFPWSKMMTYLGLILLVFLIVYIAMQEWYKRNYERHLFKNGNDLYNLISFIYNSRAGGSGDSEIKSLLRSSGWKSEKVNFALKKLDGKRTGLWEIPLFRIFEKKKMNKEIAKRQNNPIDIRFIKEPKF